MERTEVRGMVRDDAEVSLAFASLFLQQPANVWREHEETQVIKSFLAIGRHLALAVGILDNSHPCLYDNPACDIDLISPFSNIIVDNEFERCRRHQKAE